MFQKLATKFGLVLIVLSLDNISIGDNVLIAPGAFVNFNVPNNSVVLGNPGKIIHNDNATDSYITNIV